MKKRAGIMRKALIHIAKNKRWYLIGLICASILSLFLPLYQVQSFFPNYVLTSQNNCIDIFSFSIRSKNIDLFTLFLIIAFISLVIPLILLILQKKTKLVLLPLLDIPLIVSFFSSIQHIEHARNFDVSIGTYLLLFFTVLYALILFCFERSGGEIEMQKKSPIFGILFIILVIIGIIEIYFAVSEASSTGTRVLIVFGVLIALTLFGVLLAKLSEMSQDIENLKAKIKDYKSQQDKDDED